MSHNATIDDDLRQARVILDRGRAEVSALDKILGPLIVTFGGGMIVGADIYAAYRLLESFVAEIERLQASLVPILRESEQRSATLRQLLKQAEALEAHAKQLQIESQARGREIERLRAVLARVEALIDVALPRFNWGASALDAEAIQLLNEVPIEVKRVLRDG